VGEINDYINEKAPIMLSRNHPVALVVGAAGFLGSHLVERLLDKNIQVIGIDNFSTGKREYLKEASRDKNFHLVEASAALVNVNAPRLDYLVIVAEGSYNLVKLLKQAEKYNSKIVFVSSIELYDRNIPSSLSWFKKAEEEIARFSVNKKLNSRVVRLSAIFGPRMHFRDEDPMIRLIQATLLNEIQKEGTSLDFSSRALFISDAVDLITKSIFSGSTAMKIFDGVAEPIKVDEIKQVLIDPVWHENRGFVPSELPPWKTPNLDKTMQHLSWKPRCNLVTSLRKTLTYFKDNEIEVPPLGKERKAAVQEDSREEPVKEPKIEEELSSIKEGVKKWLDDGIKEEKPKKQTKDRGASSSFKSSLMFWIIGWVIIGVGILYPLFILSYGLLSYRSKIADSQEKLIKGDFDGSINSSMKAKESIESASWLLNSAAILYKVSFLEPKLVATGALLTVSSDLADASLHAANGLKQLDVSLKSIGTTEKSSTDFKKAEEELMAADNIFSKDLVKLSSVIESGQLSLVNSRLVNLKTKIKEYDNLVKRSKPLATVLPALLAVDGKKSYLIILQDQTELRPTGGLISAVAQLDLEKGKVKKVQVQDPVDLDKNLGKHVEPPKEIASDLGQSDFNLRNSNFEPDFPTSAKQMAWFYEQETGVKVDGVIALDLVSLSQILDAAGQSENLTEKLVKEDRKAFIETFSSALSKVLDKDVAWVGLSNALTLGFQNKHADLYVTDGKLWSYLLTQNLLSVMPTPTSKFEDFLFVVESNMGGNRSNYFLDRNYLLDTSIDKDGLVEHHLKISYTNRSKDDGFPEGKYKDRLRVYLPSGTTLKKVLWGETDITKQASAFSDYGRAGYSLLLELLPKEQKSLILDYQLSGKVDTKLGYKLNVNKQAGTNSDPFVWNLKGIKEDSQSTDLSVDRVFEVKF
jgi:nucleoside-diphosphate-sugar epimerase